MTQAARARKMQQLQKQIAAMHPVALELVSDEFTAANRRRFLEGVPIWMIIELSDSLNRLCAEDRRELKPTKSKSKPKRSPAP
jgi:hypothetical protein